MKLPSKSPISDLDAKADARVAVLGGTGFVGSAIARASLKCCAEVTIVARRHSDMGGDPRFRQIWGAVEDRLVLDTALQDVDWIFYAVGCPPPVASGPARGGAPKASEGLRVLLSWLSRHPGVGVTFLSSGGSVYGEAGGGPTSEAARTRPVSEHGRIKLAEERSLLRFATEHGNPVVVLRVANAYGPGQQASSGQGVIAAFLGAALTGSSAVLVDDGRPIRDYVHISDVVRAACSLRRSSGQAIVVNVGTGRGHSTGEVLRAVESVTDTKLAAQRIPRRPGDVHSIVLDTTLLASLLNWAPESLHRGLASTWERLIADHGSSGPSRPVQEESGISELR